MKILKLIFFTLLIVALILGLFLLWALTPALSPKEFSPQAIVRISLDEKKQSPFPASQENTLTVVTYNMGYASGAKNNQGAILPQSEVEQNLAEMISALQKINPDVILLQEVDFNSARSFHLNQMEKLAQALNLPYAAYAVTWNLSYLPWPYWPPAKHFGQIISGQAILSRYPLRDQKILKFAKPEINPFWYNWFYLNRLAQKIELDWQDKTLTIYNVHLEAFSGMSRGKQIKKIAQWIEKNNQINVHFIVGGDFNALWQGSSGDLKQDKQDREALMQFIKTTGLQLAGAEEEQLTFPSWNPEERIDLIFFDKSLELEDSGVLSPLEASDHLPVWGKFKNP